MAAFLDGSTLSLTCSAEGPARPNKQNLALPQTCHLEIPASTVAERKVFIIGDVHGCYDEMCALMELAKVKTKYVMFVFVGDLVNKGPKSVEVVRRLRQLPQDSVFAVRGNHEESVLREVKNCLENHDCEIPEKYDWIKGLDSGDVRFLKELPYTISIPSLNIHIAHAGILPEQPFEEQNLYNFTNMRNIIVNDTTDISSPGTVASGSSNTKMASSTDPSLVSDRNTIAPDSSRVSSDQATVSSDQATVSSDQGNLTFDPNKAEVSSKTIAGRAWISYWAGPGHVYFGHDALRGLQKSRLATGLDTGCVYGGYLTGVFANDPTSVIQVKSNQPLEHVDIKKIKKRHWSCIYAPK